MSKKYENLLRFCTPARWWGEKWREGLMVGNGKIGADIYGGVAEERILLNDASLYWMGRTSVVPDISGKIKDVRKRIDNGDFMGAQKVIPSALEQKNFRPQEEYPLPLCEFDLKFAVGDIVTGYSRVLDMEKGEVSVGYSVSGTRYKRDLFVSRANNTAVYQVTKQGSGTVNVNLSFGLMHRVNARTYEGTCNMPEGAQSRYDKQFMYFAARNEDNGTDYGVTAKVTVNGGSVRPEQGGLEIVNAQSVFIVLKTFTDSSREKEWKNLQSVLNGIKDGYDKMLKAHAALHSRLYNSVSLSLDEGEDKYIEDLLLDADSGNLTPLLAEKMYKYGRYLLIAGTCEDGRLMSPVGLWNGCYKPYRASKCVSGQLQMTYLHALQGNLSGNLEKTFDYFENNTGDYRNNALRLYGCRGIAVPVVAAPNTGRLGSTDVFAVHFTGCAGWLCNFYYKYAKQTQNVKFLKSRLMPFMKETAEFYEDFFTRSPSGLVSSPSPLPMRIADSYKITDRPVLAKNSALDFAIAADFFANIIEASEELNINKQDVARWKEFAAEIPSPQLSTDGVFKEFINSVISVDYTGISNGTLYPAYFGNSVDFLSDEETINNYIRTADKKLSEPAAQNSYNMTVLAGVYARLGDDYKAKLCLTNAVRGCAMNNLILVDKDWRGMGICGSGVWTPVQIHSNMVFTHDIQQMLMYSKGNTLKIFPALPAEWKDVAFSGFIAENGVTVSAETNSGKNLLRVRIESRKETEIDLYLPSGVKKLQKSNVCDKLSDGAFKSVLGVKVAAGKAAEFLFKYVVR